MVTLRLNSNRPPSDAIVRQQKHTSTPRSFDRRGSTVWTVVLEFMVSIAKNNDGPYVQDAVGGVREPRAIGHVFCFSSVRTSSHRDCCLYSLLAAARSSQRRPVCIGSCVRGIHISQEVEYNVSAHGYHARKFEMRGSSSLAAT